MDFKSASIGLYKDRQINRLSRTSQKKLSVFFKKQRRLLMSKLSKYEYVFDKSVGQYAEAFDYKDMDLVWDNVEASTNDELQDIVVETEENGMTEGIKFGANQFPFGQTFDLTNPNATKWFDEHGGSVDYIKGIQKTTGDQIKTIVSSAIHEGKGFNYMAKQINRRFEGFSKERSKLIAVHESAQAFEGGNRLAIDDLAEKGLQFRKRSNSMKDNKVSLMCVENDAIGWIPLDKPFPSGHQNAPFHVRCRCWIEYERITPKGDEVDKILVNKTSDTQKKSMYADRWNDIEAYEASTLGMSKTQEKSLMGYKSYNFNNMNRFMRGQLSPTFPAKELKSLGFRTKSMASIFKKKGTKTKETLVVYRGVSRRVYDNIFKYGKYTDKGFMSTTVDLTTAKKFSGITPDGYQNVMKVVLPKGVRGISFKDESELILKPGMELKLVMVEEFKDQKLRISHMAVVSKEDIAAANAARAELAAKVAKAIQAAKDAKAAKVAKAKKDLKHQQMLKKAKASFAAKAKQDAKDAKAAKAAKDAKAAVDALANKIEKDAKAAKPTATSFMGDKVETIVVKHTSSARKHSLRENRWEEDVSKYQSSAFTLTRQQRYALTSYKGAGYRDINRYLRGLDLVGGESMRERSRELANDLASIFELEPSIVDRPVQVYRGLGYSTYKRVLKNGEYVDNGFMSTSTKLDSASFFSGGTREDKFDNIMDIVLPKGTRGIAMKSEYEFLVKKGVRLKLVGIEEFEDMDLRLLHMVVVDEDDVVTRAAAAKLAAKKVEAEVRKFEDTIIGQPFESAGIFNKNGVLLSKIDGEEGNVQIGKSEKYLKGNMLTHNHPGGGTFSLQDIVFMHKYELSEIRAVDEEYIHIATPIPGVTREQTRSVGARFSDVYKDKEIAFSKKLDSGEAKRSDIDKWKCDTAHEIWTEIAKECGITYTRIKRHP